MPNQSSFGLLFFVFCFCLLSATTTAQMSIDQVPAAVTPAVQAEQPTPRQIRKTGPRHKNRLAAGRQLQRRRTVVNQGRRMRSSAVYKNQRFRRAGKVTGNSAPRRRQLMGPAYKNRRFKSRRTRMARFRTRR